MCVQYRYNTAI